MKNFALIALLLLVSCEAVNPALRTGRSRNILLQWHTPSRKPTDQIQQEDTAIWITGVEFPEGYDWRKDSLRGSVASTLLLIRDGERVVEVPAGQGTHASSDPDRHLFLQGHLYSFCFREGATWLLEDGQEVCHIAGDMVLKGLVRTTKGACSLWQNKSGMGMCAFEADRMIWENPDASCAEGMHDDPGRPTGALHETGESLCFFYSMPLISGSTQLVWYKVEDWSESLVSASSGTDRILDARMLDGRLCLAETDAKGRIRIDGTAVEGLDGSGCSWCRVFSINGAMGAIMRVYTLAGERTYLWHDGQMLGAWDNYIDVYVGSSGVMAVRHKEDGSMSFGPIGQVQSRIDGSHYFFSWRNATMADGAILLALTPRLQSASPILIRDGAATDVPLCGFVTGVYVTP